MMGLAVTTFADISWFNDIWKIASVRVNVDCFDLRTRRVLYLGWLCIRVYGRDADKFEPWAPVELFLGFFVMRMTRTLACLVPHGCLSTFKCITKRRLQKPDIIPALKQVKSNTERESLLLLSCIQYRLNAVGYQTPKPYMPITPIDNLIAL